MPKTYNCNICEYSTKDSSNWKRHINSKKHENNMDYHKFSTDLHRFAPTKGAKLEKKSRKTKSHSNFLICPHCGEGFTRSYTLKRHIEERCEINKLKTQNKEIQNKSVKQDLQHKIEIRDKEIELKDRAIDHYEKELVYTRQLLQISTEKGNKNISNYNYINKTFPDTDPLKKISYKVFVKNNQIRYINNGDDENENENDTITSESDDKSSYNSRDINRKNKPYNEQVVEDVLYSYEHDILDNYIGGAIVKEYKDPDPSKQAIWITDASRLKYIIRAHDEKEVPRWLADIQGIKTDKLLIAPIINTLKRLLILYQKKYCTIRKNHKYSYDEQQKIMQTNISIANVIGDMDDGKITKQVLHYLAKHFTINKKSIEKSMDKISKKKGGKKKKRKSKFKSK